MKFFKKKKSEMILAFERMGFDEVSITREGYESQALKNNPYWDKAIADMMYELTNQEDLLTSDPSLTQDERNRFREYYSTSRLLLSSLNNLLDDKISEMEAKAEEDKDNKDK